jgi:dTDP-4-dehydrorhamnose reductase
MNDFLVLGHRGYLGSYLSKNLLCDTLSSRDIYDNGNKYKFVINCIGKPDLEYCESNPCTTEYSNALVLKDIKIHYPDSKIINFSSYYVYDFDGLCSEKSNVTK